MLIGLDRKRLEAALIDRPGAGTVVVGMPAFGMRHRDPPQDFREFSVASGPEEQVPMIRHQTIGRNAEPRVALRLGQNLLERPVIRRFLTQGQAAHAPIQHVIGEVTGGQARPTGQTLFSRMPRSRVKKRLPTPFLCSR